MVQSLTKDLWRVQYWPVEGLGHADSRLNRERFGVAFAFILLCGASLLPELLPLGLGPAVLLLMSLLFLNLPVHPVHWSTKKKAQDIMQQQVSAQDELLPTPRHPRLNKPASLGQDRPATCSESIQTLLHQDIIDYSTRICSSDYSQRCIMRMDSTQLSLNPSPHATLRLLPRTRANCSISFILQRRWLAASCPHLRICTRAALWGCGTKTASSPLLLNINPTR